MILRIKKQSGVLKPFQTRRNRKAIRVGEKNSSMKHLKSLFFAFAGILLLSSCYTYTIVVGNGAQGNQEVTAWNHFVVFGLAPVGVSDAAELAGGATDYTIEHKHSFVNGLVAGLTFGLYTPTMTTVTK
ncbi:MAG: hypothetical protein ACJAQ4_000485 [Cryomorphaceae bacterium]